MLNKFPKFDAELLRRNAEALVIVPTRVDCAENDVLRMLYELQVHQIELEMQNDELRQEQARLRLAANVFHACLEAIVILNRKQIIVDLNQAFTNITGFSRGEMLGQHRRCIPLGRNNHAGLIFSLWRGLKRDNFWRGEIILRRKNIEETTILLAVSPLNDEQGQIENYICIMTDISHIKHYEAELEYIANYDALTGVPNRRLLADRLNQSISRAKRSNLPLAVCYLDLDGFKSVNDQYGHETGDLLLVEIAQRLLSVLRAEDTLARVGGDEFVMLLANLPTEAECPLVMERIFSVINQPLMINQYQLDITASIGIAMYLQDDASPDSLLRNADYAMYAAKQSGKNRFHLYDVEQEKRLQVHRQQLHYLNEAFERHEFLLYYQPKVDLISGLVCGAEALLRWQHPEQGLLLPKAFMHYIDGAEFEIQLGDWIMLQALEQMQIWAEAELNLIVSVNVSAKQLLEKSFSMRLALMLGSFPNLNPNCLELEILETAALNDMTQAIAAIVACKKLGVRFALDDFGTGYSSLSYFRPLPVDVLKIDQSFVQNMLNEDSNLHLIEGILRLAAAFDRPVVAEGVESAAHGAALLKLGCHLCQGFGIARPMPAQELPSWVSRWEANQPWQKIIDA